MTGKKWPKTMGTGCYQNECFPHYIQVWF